MPFQYTPPAGWEIMEQAQVITTSNQADYRNPLDNCGLKSIAVKLTGDPYPEYAPPVGWQALWIRRAAGSSSEQLYMEDMIWIDPQGKVYSVNDCTQQGWASSGPIPGTFPVAKGGGIFLALAMAVGAYFLFSE